MRALATAIGLLALIASGVPALAQAPLTAEQEQALKPRDSFKECDACPEMVMVPAGSFDMGAAKNEAGRFDNEDPQHQVTIGRPFAVGKFEVTVDQFAAFVAEAGHDMGTKCDVWQNGRFAEVTGKSWRDPGFAQTGRHPVACVSWQDAQAYVLWLSSKTGKIYRLLTEAEWEYAARGGTTTRFYFGDNEKDYCRNGNGGDQSARKSVPGAKKWTVLACSDGFGYSAPVGSFTANPFGLFDVLGNVFEWTEDCLHDNFNGAPTDGSAWTTGDCKSRVQRGGAWGYPPRYLRVAVRGFQTAGYRYVNAGMRVARSIGP